VPGQGLWRIRSGLLALGKRCWHKLRRETQTRPREERERRNS